MEIIKTGEFRLNVLFSEFVIGYTVAKYEDSLVLLIDPAEIHAAWKLTKSVAPLEHYTGLVVDAIVNSPEFSLIKDSSGLVFECPDELTYLDGLLVIAKDGQTLERERPSSNAGWWFAGGVVAGIVAVVVTALIVGNKS